VLKPRSLLLGVLSVVVVAGLLAWAFRPAALEVEVAGVTRGPFRLTVDDDGIVRVRDRFRLTAPVGGVLQRPPVKVGERVMRGHIVAVIEPAHAQLLDPRTRAELLARRDAAEARRDRATALQKQADEALRQAEQDAHRIDDLARQGFVPASDREKTALALAARRREQEAAAFEADAALHDLQQARVAASRLDTDAVPAARSGGQWILRAPVAGSVLSVMQESGGPVGLGADILEIGDVARLEAVIDVLSEEATRIASGASVGLTGGSGVELEGRVARVEPAARTRVYALGVEEQRVNVIVALPDDTPAIAQLGDGYRVEARIEVAHRDDALQVPTAALFRQADRWCVFRIADGHARVVPLDIGLRNSDTAEVLGGLAAGDRVVLYPGDALRDGGRVTRLRQSR
jgi:HlyD family secretion protein